MQCAVLDKNRSDGASALVKACLYNRTLCGAVGVSFKLFHLSYEGNHFKQVVKTFLCLCGNGNTGCVAAPFLGNKLVFGKLLLNLLGVSAHLIHFIDSDDYRNARRLGVVDSLNGLGHDSVVSRDNKNSDIGYLSAASAHGGERLVSGGVEEGDGLAVYLNAVRADVLGDSARFTRGYVGVADSVENRGLAVVDVTHNNNNGRSADEVGLVVLAVVDNFLLDCNNDLFFNLCVELHGDKRGGVEVDCVGSGNHGAHEERLFNDLGNRSFKAQSQLVYRDFVGDLDGDGLLLALEGNSLQALGLGLALALTSAALLLGAV